MSLENTIIVMCNLLILGFFSLFQPGVVYVAYKTGLFLKSGHRTQFLFFLTIVLIIGKVFYDADTLVTGCL